MKAKALAPEHLTELFTTMPQGYTLLEATRNLWPLVSLSRKGGRISWTLEHLARWIGCPTPEQSDR